MLLSLLSSFQAVCPSCRTMSTENHGNPPSHGSVFFIGLPLFAATSVSQTSFQAFIKFRHSNSYHPDRSSQQSGGGHKWARDNINQNAYHNKYISLCTSFPYLHFFSCTLFPVCSQNYKVANPNRSFVGPFGPFKVLKIFLTQLTLPLTPRSYAFM